MQASYQDSDNISMQLWQSCNVSLYIGIAVSFLGSVHRCQYIKHEEQKEYFYRHIHIHL